VSGGLFSGLFVPDHVRAATSDEAWLRALLDVEAALAIAEAEAGVIPGEAMTAIVAACQAPRFGPEAIGREARASGNPVVPLVAALTDQVPDDAAGYVHWGATSQDVMDTAAMLIAQRALLGVEDELSGVAAACARLAEEHRATPIAARTLLQQALPTTFGLKAAVWLDGVMQAWARLQAVAPAVQLGGAAGTLGSLGDHGVRVMSAFAERLALVEPALPWHTARHRVADLGAALAIAAGAVEKIALDLVLLAQTEVGEVAEASGGGRGGSSTLPHKRNPVGSVLAIACARRVRGAAGVLLEAMPQEHERAAGAWQSEWEALREALALTGGAAAAAREALEGLEVRPGRMRQNLEATGGLVLAESVTMALAERIGRQEAKRAELTEPEIDRALDPAGYLGSAEAFVDRALSGYRAGSERQTIR
jgi:3-carboxy-cis,cis-muconate cycloisomerase